MKFREFFCWERWNSLPYLEKKKHTYKNCFACLKYETYFLKKCNRLWRQQNEKVEKKDACIQTDLKMYEVVKQGIPNEVNTWQPQRSRVLTVDDVPADIKMQIIHRAELSGQAKMLAKNKQDMSAFFSSKIADKKRQQDRLKKNRDMSALFSSNVSMNTWRNIRKIQYGYYGSPVKRKHVGDLDKYSFDRKKVEDYLHGLGKGLHLGTAMRGKWQWLAREANVLNTFGKPCENSGQVRIVVFSFW